MGLESVIAAEAALYRELPIGSRELTNEVTFGADGVPVLTRTFSTPEGIVSRNTPIASERLASLLPLPKEVPGSRVMFDALAPGGGRAVVISPGGVPTGGLAPAATRTAQMAFKDRVVSFLRSPAGLAVAGGTLVFFIVSGFLVLRKRKG